MSNPLLEGLRAAGVKITQQRRAICDWLAETDSHPSAASVYDALHNRIPSLSLATVYNTLALLHELDLIHEVALSADGSMRYDANIHLHLNFVCTVCGIIIDQPVPPSHLKVLHQLAARSAFQVFDANLSIHGICQHCRSQRKIE